MSMDTNRSDLTQAVLEGVAFGLKDGLLAMGEQGAGLRRSRICGGGAKSPVWRRILANVLDLQLDLLAAEEGPALGGAMLAAVGCGAYAGVEEAAGRIVRTAGTVEPEPELVARYAERYAVWKELYPRLRELFPRMAAEN
jgi:xylulokinase